MQLDDHTARQYLNRGINTTLDTVSVGILAILEVNFGHLWGQGRSKEELTEKELQYLERWQETRSEILGKSEQCKSILLKNTARRLIVTNKERGFDD